MDYATVQDVMDLYRPLSTAEQTKATNLIPIVSAALRSEAKRVGKDLDALCTADADLLAVAKEITVRAVGSVISTDNSSNSGDLSQFSQSALGYVVSGTYANPGGGIYFKTSELKRLGLKNQRYGVMEIYDN